MRKLAAITQSFSEISESQKFSASGVVRGGNADLQNEYVCVSYPSNYYFNQITNIYKTKYDVYVAAVN
jgi:hypothetical protein